MKEVIYLLIITVIILGFISSNIIPLFRSSMDIIGSVAEKEYEGQKIKSNVLLPLEKDTVTGGDVISVIRYYSSYDDVTVEVTAGGATEVYTNTTYDSEQFNIPYNSLFSCSYEYSGDKLTKAVYSEQ